MNIIVELVSPGRFFKDAPIHSLNECLKKRGFEVVFAADQADLVRVVENNARLAGVVIDWEDSPQELCQQIHDFNEYLPVFAFSSSNSVTDATFQQLSLNVEFFEYEISNAADIAVTITQKVEEYEKAVTPPLTRALINFAKEGKYTFCTPGHMSGTAFQHSPVGALFYDFFGANTFKADVSVSVGELGSLLDHSGPHRDAEKYIAETFNADRSYIVTNGTSTANKIIGLYSAPAGSTVLIDRNCHKSLTHLMMMSNVIPIYLRPTRNAYGILGGIPAWFFTSWSAKKFGRKKTFLIAGLCTSIFGIAYGASTTLVMLLVTGVLYQFGKYLNAMMLALYTPELYETSIRTTGNGLATSWGRMGSIVGPIVLAGVMTSFGVYVTMYIAAAMVIIPGLLVFLFGPETKDKTF